jgi:prolyl-tRNA editing enzyme YbaK/EbsC (Cys-tRNA(Pro) deacylase)
VRPFSNLYGLPTCVDKRLTQEDYIVFEAGTHICAYTQKNETDRDE